MTGTRSLLEFARLWQKHLSSSSSLQAALKVVQCQVLHMVPTVQYRTGESETSKSEEVEAPAQQHAPEQKQPAVQQVKSSAALWAATPEQSAPGPDCVWTAAIPVTTDMTVPAKQQSTDSPHLSVPVPIPAQANLEAAPANPAAASPQQSTQTPPDAKLALLRLPVKQGSWKHRIKACRAQLTQSPQQAKIKQKCRRRAWKHQQRQPFAGACRSHMTQCQQQAIHKHQTQQQLSKNSPNKSQQGPQKHQTRQRLSRAPKAQIVFRLHLDLHCRRLMRG